MRMCIGTYGIGGTIRAAAVDKRDHLREQSATDTERALREDEGTIRS